MKRKFYSVLEAWEEKKTKEPLMVTGVRQVGKTWLIRKFCEDTYGDYVYINLEEHPEIASVFEGSLDPDDIVLQISQLLGRRIDWTTPLVLDEIQTSERAITSLKYFCESDRNYRVICAGSLLGVKIKRFRSSFPVGKVRIVQMHPMDFDEFLEACGETLLRDGIAAAFETGKPLAAGIHEKALRLYQDYLYVGGMPQAVKAYLSADRNAVAVDPLLYENLRLAYLADMTRYVTSPAESVKIGEVYRSIPRQLARENPKFKYKDVRTGGNKRDFSGPLDWLDASGMITRIHRVEVPRQPVKGYENEDSFKVYLSDIGLLANMCGIRYRDLLPDADNLYKGAVTENYVVEQLSAANQEMYYYKPSESMEIDLLLNLGGEVIPVEIKSGRHKRSTSLNNYREQYHPSYAVRLSGLNFGWQEGLYSVPLYAAWCLPGGVNFN